MRRVQKLGIGSSGLDLGRAQRVERAVRKDGKTGRCMRALSRVCLFRRAHHADDHHPLGPQIHGPGSFRRSRGLSRHLIRISAAAHGLVRTPRPALGHTAGMKTTVINPVKAFTLFALGLANAAMGIYVADADDAPGAAVIGMLLMVVGVMLGVRAARNRLPMWAAPRARPRCGTLRPTVFNGCGRTMSWYSRTAALSPDFNPIELAFATLKTFVRAARHCTFDYGLRSHRGPARPPHIH